MTVQFRMIRMQAAVAACGFIIVQILTGASTSLAQPFEIIGLGEGVDEKVNHRGFDVNKIGLEANSAYQRGFPEDAEEDAPEDAEEDAEEATRFASGLSVSLAPSEEFKIEPGIALTKERGEDLTVSNVALEATVSPPWFFKTDFGAGVFLALEPRIDDDATNEFVFGPIFEQKVGDKFQITINPFLEDTFGRNSEEGLAFAYGWQVKWELLEELAIGLEGFGEIEDVFGDPPGFEDQEHRIGPVIFVEDVEFFGLGFEVNFGVLAGITRETPDVAFKLNFEVSHKKHKP